MQPENHTLHTLHTQHILNVLTECVGSAVATAFPDAPASDPDIRRSQHADYQSGVALPLGKRIGQPPRKVAEQLKAVLEAQTSTPVERIEVAGPGFLNLTLKEAYLFERVSALLTDAHLGVAKAESVRTVVDYSSPNVAKEMHVGHLRSTIIGDALVRVLGFQGHEVIRQNHLGDWGTPFGMLIEHLIDLDADASAGAVGELNQFYKDARAKFDADEHFKERARLRVVALQSGDSETLALWRKLVEISQVHFMEVYALLGVELREEDFFGESQYNPRLAGIVEALEQKGLLQESEGAKCVFPPGFKGREDEPLPLIVRKHDGGFGYAATDLAALRHRAETLGAHRILYVVGAPQAQHFAMVFATGRLAGWVKDDTQLVHVAFGSVLGSDKKVLKTRSGDTVKLIELLNEGIARARAVVQAKVPDMPETEVEEIAKSVGIGAIKYADLSNDRLKDYVFDWDRMLAFDGDTAPYLMYAHARCCSILRKAGIAGPEAIDRLTPPGGLEPAERALILQLLDFPVAIEKTGENLQLNRLCRFLYELATTFTKFFDTCHVLRAENPVVKDFRLGLCAVTARTLALGLGLLGVAAPPRL